jgi:hypothetical protein
MKHIIAMVFLIFSTCNAVQASSFTEEMSNCLVQNTSEQDKTLLIQWTYAAMSAHPSVRSMSNISPVAMDDLNKRAAEMLMELLVVKCKTETQQAIKIEGETSFQTGLATLGKVAMQGLIYDANVVQYQNGLSRYFDANKLRDAFGQ